MTKVRTHDGRTVDVAPEQAQVAYQRGEAQFDGPVQVVKGKEAGEVDPGDDLNTALAQGWKLATPEQQHKAKLSAEESDLGSNAQGLGEAAWRGLTLGYGDDALVALGVDPERIEARRDELDGAATAFEVLGGAAPALLSSGTGLAAAAARLTPAGRSAMIGRGLGGAVEAGLGGGSVAKVAGATVGGAAEGALAGVGAEWSAAALGERELAADQLWAAAGRGAGLGALLGGGTVGVGEGLAAAYAGTSRVSKDLLKLSIGVGDDVGTPSGLAAAAGDTLVDRAARRQVELLSRAAGHAPEETASFVAAAERQLARTHTVAGRELLEQAATARTPKALDKLVEPRLRPHIERSTTDLDELVGQAERQLQREAPQASAAVARVRDTASELLTDPTRYGIKLSKGNKTQLEAALARADEGGAGGAYRWLRETVAELDGLKPKGKGSEAITQIRTMLADTLEGPTFSRGRGYGQLLDARAAAKPLPRKPGAADIDALIDQRTKVLGLAQEAGLDTRKAAATLEEARAGVRYRAELEAAATDHAALVALEEGVGGTVRKGLELAGEGAGAILGGLSFGGVALGRTVGLVAGLGTKPAAAYRTIARARGIIDKVREQQGATLARVDTLLAQGVERAAKGSRLAVRGVGRTAAGRQAAAKRRERLTDTIARVARLAAQPLDVADEVGPSLEELHTAAPEVATAALEGAARAVQYLASVAPPVYRPPYSKEAMITPEDLDIYERKLEAVEAPLEVLDLLGSAALTVDHAEALEAVYPSLYRDMQERILELVGEHGDDISHGFLVQMGVLGSVMTDDSLRHADYVMIQAAVAPPNNPPPAPPPTVGAQNMLPTPSKWEAMEAGR